MARRRRNQDSPWKELIERECQRFFAFFFPRIHADLNWARDYESLDTEFLPLVPAAPQGTRIADRLIKHFRRRKGDPRFFHIEIQARYQSNFPERVYTYNKRAEECVGNPVTSLVVLLDGDPDWRPEGYTIRLYERNRGLEFHTVKLTDWLGREDSLRADPNPVGLFVLAALEANRTQGDDDEREAAKLALILNLTQRNMDPDTLRQWYRYLDWLLPLPPQAEARLLVRFRQIEEETQVPFITFAEREGRWIGEQEGLQAGLVRGLALALRLKFGTAGTAFADEIQSQPATRLQAILDGVESAQSVDDLRKLL